MRLKSALLDAIALTPGQLAMERLGDSLPLMVVLVIAVVIAAAVIIRRRRK